MPETVRKTLTDALADDNERLTVAKAMTDDVDTIEETASVQSAAAKLIRCCVHHLPVVDTDQRPIGIVAASDIVRAVADSGV